MIRLAVLCGTCLNQDRFRRTESISLQLANWALHQTSRVSFLSPGWSKCKSNCPSWTLAAGPVRRIICSQQSSAESVAMFWLSSRLCEHCHSDSPLHPGVHSAPELGSVQECIRSSLREAGIRSLDIQIQEPFVVACGRHVEDMQGTPRAFWKSCHRNCTEREQHLEIPSRPLSGELMEMSP